MYGVWKFIAARHGLYDDVLFFDARGFEGLEGALEEGVDEFGVPAGVDDATAEVGACAGGGL